MKIYNDLNIEKGVLLPLASPEFQHEYFTSGDCKYVADKYPERFLWFCGLDPKMFGNNERANLTLILEHYKKLGALGVGELTTNIYVDDPLMENLFYHCSECDMPVTIHIAPQIGGFYGIVDDLGLPRLEKILQKYPRLKIFGHSQLFWAEISADVDEVSRCGYPTGKVIDGKIAQLMRKYENLYCDFSAGSGMNALMRDPEHAAKFMEEFSDRILYGCDICIDGQQHAYRFEEFLDKMRADGMLKEETYYKFVRGNAERILKLK